MWKGGGNIDFFKDNSPYWSNLGHTLDSNIQRLEDASLPQVVQQKKLDGRYARTLGTARPLTAARSLALPANDCQQRGSINKRHWSAVPSSYQKLLQEPRQ